MFTWVCPTCGREWDLATKRCPDCVSRAAQPAPAPAAPPASSFRFWLVVAVATVAAVLALYAVSRYRRRPVPAPATPAVQLELPAGSTASPPPRPLEVAGIRLFYDAQSRPQVRAVLVNHGDEDLLPGFTLTVALRPTQAAPGSPPLARFTVKLETALKSGDSRDVRAPLDALATLAAMPPWQQLRADLE